MMEQDKTSILLLAVAFIGLSIGCSNHGSVDVLESQLRDREDQISDLRDELEDEHHNLQAAREEAIMLRQQLAADHRASPVELTNGVVRVAEIRIHPLLTGPLDTDADGGDDQLIVLLQPRDDRHKTVEAVGEIDVKLTHGKQLVKQWKVTPDEAINHWRSSKMGSGIMLQLSLDHALSSDKHLIEAELRTANDRTFTARHTFETP